MKTPAIAYYISAHGYGHGVRSSDIVRALRRMYPELRLVIVTSLPEAFLRNRLGEDGVRIMSGSFDVGMIQLDSIRVDLPATLRAVQSLNASRESLIASQIEFFRKEGIRLVVTDIPAIPLAAAKRFGIPSVAVGNFSWDWIYDEFVDRDPMWRPLVDQFQADYLSAELLLRLPFSPPMTSFKRVEDVPLVATPGRNRREELAQLTKCDPGKKWGLLSFTSLDWDDDAVDRVERQDDHEFFTVEPLGWYNRRNIHPINREVVPFSDVIASVDVVISKPGFGLLSECVVNGKPLIYADRTDFREYAVMVEQMKRCLRTCHLPAAKLYRGELGEALQSIWSSPEPEHELAAGGDVIVAARIAAQLAK